MQIAINEKGPIFWPLSSFTRHGLIAGGTGSGKSVTLKLIAEQLSANGVPCFIGDVKGDLGGFASKGDASQELISRCHQIGADVPDVRSYPVQWWCPWGENGNYASIPLSRVSSEVIASIIGASQTQLEVLDIVFQVAREYGWSHDEPHQVRDIINWIVENRSQLSLIYGGLQTMTLQTINRRIMSLAGKGPELFGRGDFSYRSLIKNDERGEGFISVLDSMRLSRHPELYAMFMVWLLSDLYESLPELGNVDKPILVLFFDEAHLIFKNSSRALTETLGNIVRLIRSKGVGVIFASQSPVDIPDSILGQLGSRVQHAMRGATPRDMQVVRSAASSMPFPRDSNMKPERVISSLATGEALVSFLQNNGTPMPTERAWVMPPNSYIGPAKPGDNWQAILEERERQKALRAAQGGHRMEIREGKGGGFTSRMFEYILRRLNNSIDLCE